MRPKSPIIRRLLRWIFALWMGWAALASAEFRAHGAGAVLERWELRYPNHPDLGEIVFANGIFVSLSASGQGPPFTSGDGLTWAHLTVHSDTWTTGFSEISNGNGSFVGVTRDGQVLMSNDGTNWTATSFTPVIGTANNRNIHIAAGNGLLVTASDLGEVSVSSDGIIWGQPRPLPACARRLWFGNGTFAAMLGCDSNSSIGVWTSSDGVTWNPPVDPLGLSIIDLSFSDGIFTAVNSQYQLLVSADALNWVAVGSVPLDSDWPATYLIHGNGRFVGFSLDPAGEGVLVASSDGVNWVKGPSLHEPQGIAFGNGRFVISGRDVLISPDGQNWTTQPSNDGALPLSVAFGNGRFVAVGGKSILYSLDGESWEPVLNPGSARLPVGIYFANGLFLGPSWPSYNEADATDQQGVLMTSVDGVTWTEHFGDPFLSSLRSIVYGAGVFVAIGEGNGLFVSADGINWSEAAHFEFVSNIVFGNGIFLASAQAQTGPGNIQSFMYGSVDGRAWTQLAAITGRFVMLSTYGNGLFVAQALESASRYVLTSSDGSNWSIVYEGKNPGIASGAYSAYAAGRFVILSPYTVLSSPDAVNWIEESADTADPLADQVLHPALAFGMGTLVTAVRGTLQQSAQVPPPYVVRVLSGGESPSSVGTGGGKFTFERSGSPQIDIGLRVHFQIGGSAQMGVDYRPIADSVVIAAGQSSASLRIVPATDVANPEDKLVVLTLLPDDSYTISSPSTASLSLADAKPPPPLATPSLIRSNDGSGLLTVSSLPGAAFVVEVSTDLANWDSLAVVSNPTSVMEFSDPDAVTSSYRFYRLRFFDPPSEPTAP